MCGSIADIQSLTAEIRRGKKERRKKERKKERKKKPQGKNIMVCPILWGDHNKRQHGYLPITTQLPNTRGTRAGQATTRVRAVVKQILWAVRTLISKHL